MEQVWGLVALIGAAQILNSVKQLKNSRREMLNCTPKVRLLEVQFFHDQILRRI